MRATSLERLMVGALAFAVCTWVPAARADDPALDNSEFDTSVFDASAVDTSAVDTPVDNAGVAASGAPGDDGSQGVPELDPRSAGLALTVLGGALFLLNGRRKRAIVPA